MTRLVVRIGTAVLLGLGVLVMPMVPEAVADSGVYVDIRESDAPGAPVVDRWKLYGASHALVIGIDNYTNGWPRLSNAVKDASLVAEELRRQGFEVELLSDVSSQRLRGALHRFFAVKGADPEARLFVWFAGHGYSEDGEGYLVPADGPLPGGPEFQLTALHLGEVGAMVRIAKSKHALAVFDSCFAGTIFSSQRSRPPEAVTLATVRPVRQFLTSGDADQEVSDDGAFRRLFVGALSGEERADLNGDGYLTGTELSLYLEDRMINLTRAAQTPRGGKLRDPRYDRGDFVFVLREGATAPQVAAQPLGADPREGRSEDFAAELAFWNAIADSDRPGDYRAYLETYPKGRFAALARVRAEPPQRQTELANLTPASKVPEAERERLEAYFKRRDYAIKQQLWQYNKHNGVGTVPWTGSSKVRVIYSAEIVAIEGDSTIVRLLFLVGAYTSKKVFQQLYEMRWVGDKLEIVGHRTG